MERKRPSGPEATKLRQRKSQLLRRLQIPESALPGSLALTHSKCGTPTCHCAKDKGHPGWSLTFMVEGKKRVERIPAEWVDEVRRQVEEGREFKKALAEILNANAQLLSLERKERRRRKG